jgi:hypothetical protein
MRHASRRAPTGRPGGAITGPAADLCLPLQVPTGGFLRRRLPHRLPIPLACLRENLGSGYEPRRAQRWSGTTASRPEPGGSTRAAAKSGSRSWSRSSARAEHAYNSRLSSHVRGMRGAHARIRTTIIGVCAERSRDLPRRGSRRRTTSPGCLPCPRVHRWGPGSTKSRARLQRFASRPRRCLLR